jgi:hypothetical protein
LAAEASRRQPGAPAPALLGVAACREQGRFAEAELLLRGVTAEHPELIEGQALLAAVLADLGRDADARRQLDALLDRAGDLPPAVAAPAAEAAAALRSADHGDQLLDVLAAHAPAGAAWYGSLARHLGLACHVAGRWDQAEGNFTVALEANASAGAPVLVAHTRRHYAALLRARGGPGDWELATELLSGAAAVYRRLEIVPLADQAEAVLRRAHDAGAGAGVFRRTGTGWEVGFAGRRAEIPAAGAGMDHIAELLAAAGRPLYAVDLLRAGADPRVEYRARIADLESHATTTDPLAAALARAECDVLAAELSAPAGDAGERARRLVILRIRLALDHLNTALPELGHHLRRGIQTGTFCLYEPAPAERWSLGPR